MLSDKTIFFLDSLNLKFRPEWKCEFVENSRTPFFAEYMQKFIEENSRYPNQIEFGNYYIQNCKETLKDMFGEKDKYIKGVKCRILKSYPSLLRDHLLAEDFRNRGYNSKYDVNDDIYKGIDITVVNSNGVPKYLFCMKDTYDAKEKFSKKINRHDKDYGDIRNKGVLVLLKEQTAKIIDGNKEIVPGYINYGLGNRKFEYYSEDYIIKILNEIES